MKQIQLEYNNIKQQLENRVSYSDEVSVLRDVHKLQNEVLGSGGNGIVSALVNDDTLVSKINRVNAYSHNWGKQVTMQQQAHDELDKLTRGRSIADRIMIPNIIEYHNYEDIETCQIIMERIYPLCGQNRLIQTLFGDYDNGYDKYLDELRGLMLSPQSLEHIINGYASNHSSKYNSNYEQACHDIGVLIACVQYGCKQTGDDLELVLGSRRANDRDTYLLALIDFDRSEPYQEFNVDKMVDPLTYLPFYPVEHEAKGRKFFKKAYLKTANKFNMLEQAKQVLRATKKI
jgi:hypothetical protein